MIIFCDLGRIREEVIMVQGTYLVFGRTKWNH